jgi:hypothetical protein
MTLVPAGRRTGRMRTGDGSFAASGERASASELSTRAPGCTGDPDDVGVDDVHRAGSARQRADRVGLDRGERRGVAAPQEAA